MAQKIVIAILLVWAGTGFLLIGHDQTAAGQMMGGGMMGGGMMGQTPQGNSSQPLPDQQSNEAQLYEQDCSQCHALPSPFAHTAQEWPSVVARMKKIMATRGMALPDDEQLEEIMGYLQQHAQ